MVDNLTVNEIVAKCEIKTRKLKRVEAEFESTRNYFNHCNFIRFDVKSIVFKQYEKDINKLKAEINNLYTQLDRKEVF